MRKSAFTFAAASALLVLAPAQDAFAKKKPPAEKSESQKISKADKGERQRAERLDLLSLAAFWTGEFNKDASDLEAGQKLAETLRHIGQSERAIEVANQSLGFHPNDPTLLLTAGRALIENGQPQQAIPALQRAAQIDQKDWRAPSAIGVALDSMGRRQEAQSAYGVALTLKPNDAGILSNLGLSTALSGDIAKAAAILTQAAAAPDADAQVRQNLAIVLAMQGRYDEANEIGRKDLPSDVAAANTEYVRSMMSSSDGRRWDSLKNGLGVKNGG